MRLINPEIDVNPENAMGQAPNAKGVQRNGGHALMSLHNSSGVENRFTVWISAADEGSRWLERYCSIEMAATEGGIRDERVDRKYLAYVATNKERSLMVRTRVPKSPEARAGAYRMEVWVESDHPVEKDGEKLKLATFPLTIVVRPNLAWSIAFPGGDTIMRLLKRRATLWAEARNTGNDWVYCDLSLPKTVGELTLECDSKRIAIPPAASTGEPGVVRVAVRVASRYRRLRGGPIPVSVALGAVRVDAPSVARFPSTENVVPTLEVARAVLTQGTSERTAANASVVYHPPIPPTVAAFFVSLRTSAMAVFSLVLMGMALFYVSSFVYENLAHKYGTIDISPRDKVDVGKPIRVSGPGVLGSEIVVTSDDLGELKSSVKWEGPVTHRVALLTIDPANPIAPGSSVKIDVRRRGFGFIPWHMMYPHKESKVTVGEKPLPVEPLQLAPMSKVALHELLVIEPDGSTDFGKKPGNVQIGGSGGRLADLVGPWNPKKIVVMVPDDKTLATASTPITVTLNDGKTKAHGIVEIVDVPPAFKPSKALVDLATADSAKKYEDAADIATTEPFGYSPSLALYGYARAGLTDKYKAAYPTWKTITHTEEVDHALYLLAQAAYSEALMKDVAVGEDPKPYEHDADVAYRALEDWDKTHSLPPSVSDLARQWKLWRLKPR